MEVDGGHRPKKTTCFSKQNESISYKKKYNAASEEAAKKAKYPPGRVRALWECSKDMLGRIKDHEDLEDDDKTEIVNIINNEQDFWEMLLALYGIFFKYVDDNDGSLEICNLPISLRTLLLDIIDTLPGKYLIIRAGRTSNHQHHQHSSNLESNLAQNNKLRSTCLAMDCLIGSMLVVPGTISGIASVGMDAYKKGTEEHTIFGKVCDIVSIFAEACKSKQVVVVYTDVQRLSRLPDKCIERKNELKELGAIVKFGKQFVEDEDESYLDDYLDEWRDELDAYNEESNQPTSKDCAKGLRSEPSYIKQYLPGHEAICKEAKAIEKETLKSCTETSKGVYVPRKGTELLKSLEDEVALGEAYITNLDIDMPEWKGIVDTIMDDPSKVNSKVDDFCKKVQASNEMGNKDIPLFFNRLTPMTVQGGKKLINRIVIDIGGGTHSNYQIALNRSALAHSYNGSPPTRIAIVTMHRKRNNVYAKDIAQVATSIALKNHSDLVMTLTTRLSNKHPLVMFIRQLCIVTGTNYLLSLGHGLAISDVASAEESREEGATTNLQAKVFNPKEGSCATFIINASTLQTIDLADADTAVDDDDAPDSKVSATAAKKPAAKKSAAKVDKKKPATKSNKVSTKKTPASKMTIDSEEEDSDDEDMDITKKKRVNAPKRKTIAHKAAKKKKKKKRRRKEMKDSDSAYSESEDSHS